MLPASLRTSRHVPFDSDYLDTCEDIAMLPDTSSHFRQMCVAELFASSGHSAMQNS